MDYRALLSVSLVIGLALGSAAHASQGTDGNDSFDPSQATPGWELPGKGSLEPDSPKKVTRLEQEHCLDLTKAANGAMLRRQRGQSFEDANAQMHDLIGPTTVDAAELDNLLQAAYSEKRLHGAKQQGQAVYGFRMNVLLRCRQRALMR